MKKLLLVLPVIFLLAAGCNSTPSQPVTQQNNNETPTPVASSTPQIKYSSNPKVIGKELRGFTSIPDKYKPEDTLIDLDALAAPYLSDYISGSIKAHQNFHTLQDPLGRFAVEGYEMKPYDNNRGFEIPVYERQLFIQVRDAADHSTPSENVPRVEWAQMFRFKTKTTVGYIDRKMDFLLINDNNINYYIAYGPELRDSRYPELPFNSELFIVGSTFRLLK